MFKKPIPWSIEELRVALPWLNFVTQFKIFAWELTVSDKSMFHDDAGLRKNNSILWERCRNVSENLVQDRDQMLL